MWWWMLSVEDVHAIADLTDFDTIFYIELHFFVLFSLGLIAYAMKAYFYDLGYIIHV